MRNLNPKSEYRNPKQILNSNVPNSKQNWFGKLGFGKFGFVSNFVLRASDLTVPIAIILTLIIIGLILPQTCQAATYYVAVNGDDTNVGSEIAPFKTIQHAADIVRPGDTVMVKEGIYREEVTMKTSGTQDNPIVFKTDPKHRAVISGAEVVVEGWQLLEGGNNIYYADIPDIPVLPSWMRRRFLKEDQRVLSMARLPKEGWWVPEGATENTLTDTLNLAPFTKAEDLIGAEVFYHRSHSNDESIMTITDYNPLTKTITFDTSITHPRPGKDLYFLQNKLNLLSQPGEWALEMNRTPPRLYVRPSDAKDINSHTYEYAKRNQAILINGKSYITIQGFEIRDGLLYGVYGSGDGLRLLNCHFTANTEKAAYIRGGKSDIMIRDNVIENNGNGIIVLGSATDPPTWAENVLIEHNHIFNNGADGLILSWHVKDAKIIRNFIHDHVVWAHPDNIQFFQHVYNVAIENNVLFNGGQSIMLEKTSGGQIKNNLIVGANASSINIGYNNSYPYKIIGNTITLTQFSTIATGGEPTGLTEPVRDGFDFDYEFKNNILAAGHNHGYGFNWSNPNVSTDYNLISGTFSGNYAGRWVSGLENWKSVSGLDSHSKEANPFFVNAPQYFSATYYRPLCTKQKLYFRAYQELFNVGDHVEVNFDGIDRVITEKGSQPYTKEDDTPITIYYIVINPALTKEFEKCVAVANWKDRPVSELDLRLRGDSPGLGMGEGGIDVGYAVDFAALRRSDFDGDGVIDDPGFRDERVIILYGDVNADSEVSAFDAALAAHIAVDLVHPDIKNRVAAEVSGDGEVTAYDAALIAQKAVGLIDRFPVEE